MHRPAILALFLFSCTTTKEADIADLQWQVKMLSDGIRSQQEAHAKVLDQVLLDVQGMQDKVLGMQADIERLQKKLDERVVAPAPP